MNQTASIDLRSTHPLSGLEGWPKTGPVYGPDEDEAQPRVTSFWHRMGERFRKAPSAAPRQAEHARIWY